jgi:hypothetical protein
MEQTEQASCRQVHLREVSGELAGDIDLTINNPLEVFMNTSFETGNADLSLRSGLSGPAR